MEQVHVLSWEQSGMADDGIKIGELAEDSGVSRDAIRFYEREKLLPSARRTSSGHRVYDREALRRLRFIRGAQSLGLTLEDIRELLRLRQNNPSETGRWVTKCLRVRAEAIEYEIGKLRIFRELLGEVVERYERSPSRAFSVLDRFFVDGRH